MYFLWVCWNRKNIYFEEIEIVVRKKNKFEIYFANCWPTKKCKKLEKNLHCCCIMNFHSCIYENYILFLLPNEIGKAHWNFSVEYWHTQFYLTAVKTTKIKITETNSASPFLQVYFLVLRNINVFSHISKFCSILPCGKRKCILIM